MGAGGGLTRAANRIVARGLGRGVTSGAVLEDVRRAAAAGVVIVTLEEVAKGRREVLVTIAVAVADDFDARGVRVHTSGETRGPDEPVIALGPRRGLGVEGPSTAALVDVARSNAVGLAGLISERATAVTSVEVEFAIGAGDNRVQRVVMVLTAETAEEHFAFINGGVEFAVAVHVGELDEVGRMRDDYDIIKDRDAERRGPARVLDEGVGRVGLASALAVAEYHDAIAFGPALAALIVDAVVHAFGHPHAPLGIDVQVRWVGQHRRARPDRDL